MASSKCLPEKFQAEEPGRLQSMGSQESDTSVIKPLPLDNMGVPDRY